MIYVIATIEVADGRRAELIDRQKSIWKVLSGVNERLGATVEAQRLPGATHPRLAELNDNAPLYRKAAVAGRLQQVRDFGDDPGIGQAQLTGGRDAGRSFSGGGAAEAQVEGHTQQEQLPRVPGPLQILGHDPVLPLHTRGVPLRKAARQTIDCDAGIRRSQPGIEMCGRGVEHRRDQR